MKDKQLSAIIIAIAGGLIAGLLIRSLPEPAYGIVSKYLVGGVLHVCGRIFIRLLLMIVAPVVFISLVSGILSINDPKTLGKIGLKSAIYFLVTTLLATFTGLAAAFIFNPGAGAHLKAETVAEKPAAAKGIADAIISIVPPGIFEPFIKIDLMQMIFIATATGILLTLFKNEFPALINLICELERFSRKFIGAVILLLPAGVFCLMTETFASLGNSAMTIYSKFILTNYVGFTFFFVFIDLAAVYFFLKISPVHFVKKYFPVILFASSVASSNATLALNIETATKKLGISKNIASFILSLGATVNMNGVAIMQTISVYFVAAAYDIPMPLSKLPIVIVTIVISSIGTAGVPRGAILTLGIVLASLGLPQEAVAGILAIDCLIAGFRVTLNVTGDAICAAIVAQSEGMLNRKILEHK